jgi:hypothetical protein
MHLCIYASMHLYITSDCLNQIEVLRIIGKLDVQVDQAVMQVFFKFLPYLFLSVSVQ